MRQPRTVRYMPNRSPTMGLVRQYNRWAKWVTGIAVSLIVTSAQAHSAILLGLGILLFGDGGVIAFYGGYRAVTIRRGVQQKLEPFFDTLPRDQWLKEVVQLLQFKGWRAQLPHILTDVVTMFAALDPAGRQWIIALPELGQSLQDIMPFVPSDEVAIAPLFIIDRSPRNRQQRVGDLSWARRHHVVLWTHLHTMAEFVNYVVAKSLASTASVSIAR